MRNIIIHVLLGLSIIAAPAASGANSKPLGIWLTELRQEAVQQGISQSLVNQALSEITLIPRIIELDRRQPESTMTMQEYLTKVVPQSRIDRARREFQENRELLEATGKKYGVQPQYIVALWAVESNFGERMGDFEIVNALATLAYDGRRSTYFRKELINALKILDQGHIPLHEMKGSWAGAMGQCQFMPSSFLNYAVDGNGDGRKDIWNTRADVFASIANYLHSEGWDPSKGWGTKAAPRDNFNVILRWNRSRHFATAVGRLADLIVHREG